MVDGEKLDPERPYFDLFPIDYFAKFRGDAMLGEFRPQECKGEFGSIDRDLWTHSQQVRNGLSFNSHLMYTGAQYADADNQQRAPSWWRWDVGMRYITEAWQGSNAVFRLRATNITNRHYWASVGGYPGAGYLTLGEPRAFIGSLSIDF